MDQEQKSDDGQARQQERMPWHSDQDFYQELATVHPIDKPLVDVAVGVVIILNAAFMGLELDSIETQVNEISERLVWYVFEVIFGIFFTAEFAARVYVHRYDYFKKAMNLFDTSLVLLTILDTFILSPMASGGSVRFVGALRVIRMMRLVRLIRLLPHFKELWLIVNGLAHSLKTLSWVSLLLSVVIYLFAIFATQNIGQNDDAYNDYYEQTAGSWDHELFFGTVPRSMLTFFQICTLDKWSENIVRHVKVKQPGMELFFVFFIIFTTFGLLNLVVGVIVENTLASAKVNETKMKKKKEKDRLRVLNHLREFFEQSDEDGSGTLTVEEVQNAMKDPDAMAQLKLVDLPLDDPQEIFTLLDIDNSGELSIDEFISGCMRIKGAAKSKDLLAVQIAVDTLGTKFSELNQIIESAGDLIMALDTRTRDMMAGSERVFLPERARRAQNDEYTAVYDE